MAAIQAEMARLVPAGVGELPAVLQRGCGNLPAVYRASGALLIAEHDAEPVGCVGLAPAYPHTAEIKRPAHRGSGIAPP